jgi:hypothetical protein
MYDTEEGEVKVPWYKVYIHGDTSWIACNQGGADCGTQQYSCGEAVAGGTPKGDVETGVDGCQAKFCDFETFAAGCCEGTVLN